MQEAKQRISAKFGKIEHNLLMSDKFSLEQLTCAR